MALIKCPECRKKVSEQCEQCPHCGYPIRKTEGADLTPQRKEENVYVKPLYQKWWLWLAICAILAVIIAGVLFFINRDTKPKFDKNGNPIFVELTNEVYTNAEKYKGFHVDIKGQVFQILEDDGISKGIQIWLDPETCEQNLVIYYTSGVDVKQGDYISCSGYIDSVVEYKNTYNAKRNAPLVHSADLKKTTYKDVMAPTIETINLENLQKESKGYAVVVEKVEFSETETRVYVSVENNGKAALYFGDAVILQEGKQYNSSTNYDADYEKVAHEIIKGAKSSGVIVFPAVNIGDFELSFDIYSTDFSEKIGAFVFLIKKEGSSVKDPEKPIETLTIEKLKQEKKGYAISVDKVEFYDEETWIYLTVVNKGKANLIVSTSSAVILQSGKQYNVKQNYIADYEELPNEIIKGATVSGVILFPKVSSDDFELTIELYSENYDENLNKFTFKVSKNPVQDNSGQTGNEPTNPAEPVNRNTEAVAEAIKQAERWFPTDRHFIKHILMEPSSEEGFDAFSRAEAEYAIENANIDWKKHAVGKAMETIDWYGDDCSQKSLYDLTRVSGDYCNCTVFTDEELQYAIYNCGVDWNARAISDMKDYWDNDYNVIVTAYDFADYLSKQGYYDEVIEYALDNTNGYYRGEAVASEEERVKLLLSYGYTRQAIIGWYNNVMSYDEAEALVDSCM